MKKLVAACAALALTVGLAGCAQSESNEAPVSESTETEVQQEETVEPEPEAEQTRKEAAEQCIAEDFAGVDLVEVSYKGLHFSLPALDWEQIDDGDSLQYRMGEQDSRGFYTDHYTVYEMDILSSQSVEEAGDVDLYMSALMNAMLDGIADIEEDSFTAFELKTGGYTGYGAFLIPADNVYDFINGECVIYTADGHGYMIVHFFRNSESNEYSKLFKLAGTMWTE